MCRFLRPLFRRSLMLEEMAGKGRMHALDGLRGLAALGVVLLHVWIYTGANAPDKSLTTDLWMGELRLCVLLFFVLSGFLLALPWVAAARGEREAPKLGRYIARRAARIVPAYWLVLARARGPPRAPARHRPRPRRAAAGRAEVRLLPPERVPGDAQPARPADVVAARRGVVLRRAPADRARPDAPRPRPPRPAGRVRRADRRRRRVDDRRRAGRLGARGHLDAADLPRHVLLRHHRGRARPRLPAASLDRARRVPRRRRRRARRRVLAHAGLQRVLPRAARPGGRYRVRRDGVERRAASHAGARQRAAACARHALLRRLPVALPRDLLAADARSLPAGLPDRPALRPPAHVRGRDRELVPRRAPGPAPQRPRVAPPPRARAAARPRGDVTKRRLELTSGPALSVTSQRLSCCSRPRATAFAPRDAVQDRRGRGGPSDAQPAVSGLGASERVSQSRVPI